MPKMKSPALKWTQNDSSQFDPNTLTADKVNVEIEIGPSILFAYGTILRNFINLKVCALSISESICNEFIISKYCFGIAGKYIW